MGRNSPGDDAIKPLDDPINPLDEAINGDFPISPDGDCLMSSGAAGEAMSCASFMGDRISFAGPTMVSFIGLGIPFAGLDMPCPPTLEFGLKKGIGDLSGFTCNGDLAGL